MSAVFSFSLLFVGSVLLSLLLYRIFLKFSNTLGIRNHDVSIIRWSADSKPALGGLCFYLIFLLAFIAYFMGFMPDGGSLELSEIGWILAVTVAFLMGLSDDAYNTKPWLKFSVQVACGVILIATGTVISLFPWEWANVLLTLFWVVAVMNSLNMLDNMDAVTTIVSIFVICTAILLSVLLDNTPSFDMVMLLGVGGALVGFLFYNWHPSKMFMGDTGSQFLGIFLAAVGIEYFWNNTGFGYQEIPAKQLLITLLAFIIPISDSLTVTINRIGRGQSPFVGGKDHTTHHLSYLGLKDNQIGLLFVAISLISFLFIYIIVNFVQNWSHWFTALFFIWFLIILIGLYSTTKVKKAKQRFNELSNP